MCGTHLEPVPVRRVREQHARELLAASLARGTRRRRGEVHRDLAGLAAGRGDAAVGRIRGRRAGDRDARDGYATSALDAIAGSSPKLLSSGSMLSRTAVPAACARPRQLPRGCSPHVVDEERWVEAGKKCDGSAGGAVCCRVKTHALSDAPGVLFVPCDLLNGVEGGVVRVDGEGDAEEDARDEKKKLVFDADAAAAFERATGALGVGDLVRRYSNRKPAAAA